MTHAMVASVRGHQRLGGSASASELELVFSVFSTHLVILLAFSRADGH